MTAQTPSKSSTLMRQEQRGSDDGQMGRRTDETDYVVENLRRARQTIIAHPEWFEPDAVERIDKAVASVQAGRLGIKAA